MPFIDVGWGSHTNVYFPFFSVTVKVLEPTAGTLVATLTPGPLSLKLWMLDLSARTSLILPAFVGFFARTIVNPGPTVPLNVGVAAIAGIATTSAITMTRPAANVRFMRLLGGCLEHGAGRTTSDGGSTALEESKPSRLGGPGARLRSGIRPTEDAHLPIAEQVAGLELGRASHLATLVEDTPEIVVDIGVVKDNIAREQREASANGVNLRPHAKTHKLPSIARIQLVAGAVGVQVAKLGEAEVMIDAGIDDVLVGYPIVGTAKLARLADLAERASVSVTVDSLEVATGVAAVARARGITIRALIELDTGLRRLGVTPGAVAADLAERVAALPGIELLGVFTHEGHVYGQGRTEAEKERLTFEACNATVETAEMIRSRGLPAPVVSVGSAGTFRFAVRCPGVTEVRPGTYVFNDWATVRNGWASLSDCAMYVAVTVVSRPTETRAILDGGSKTLSSEVYEGIYGHIMEYPNARIYKLNEEHAYVDVSNCEEQPQIGERIHIVPVHTCVVTNLHNQIYGVRGEDIEVVWTVAARGLVW